MRGPSWRQQAFWGRSETCPCGARRKRYGVEECPIASRRPHSFVAKAVKAAARSSLCGSLPASDTATVESGHNQRVIRRLTHRDEFFRNIGWIGGGIKSPCSAY